MDPWSMDRVHQNMDRVHGPPFMDRVHGPPFMDRVHGPPFMDRVHGPPNHGPGPWTPYFYKLRLYHKLRFDDL